MKNKYQLDNPNNCRIRIDFNNPNKPVNFEYVGNDSAFKICYRLFRGRFYAWFGLPMVGIIFYFMAYYKFTLDINYFKTSLFFLILFYGTPLFFAIIYSQTKLIRGIPYIWAFGKTKYYVQFESKDIKNNQVEIPLFGNQFLNYKLQGDFINKINSIDIIEHPFNILVLKGRNKKELKPNEFLWKAIFTFKEKPKDGLLIVIFS